MVIGPIAMKQQYNKDDACPHCWDANDGVSLMGQEVGMYGTCLGYILCLVGPFLF